MVQFIQNILVCGDLSYFCVRLGSHCSAFRIRRLFSLVLEIIFFQNETFPERILKSCQIEINKYWRIQKTSNMSPQSSIHRLSREERSPHCTGSVLCCTGLLVLVGSGGLNILNHINIF